MVGLGDAGAEENTGGEAGEERLQPADNRRQDGLAWPEIAAMIAAEMEETKA